MCTNSMQNFPEVFGSNTFATKIEPQSLAIMMAAAAFNLTGARNIISDSTQYSDSRAALIAKNFADCALYIQRIYSKNPNARIVILGVNSPCTALIADPSGDILFDPCESTFAYGMPGVSYNYSVGDALVSYPVLADISILEAQKELVSSGLWKDNAWNLHEDKPRGQDYL